MGKNVKERDISPFDKIQAELSVESDPVIDNDFLSFINATTTRLNNIKSIQWWCQPSRRNNALDIRDYIDGA